MTIDKRKLFIIHRFSMPFSTYRMTLAYCIKSDVVTSSGIEESVAHITGTVLNGDDVDLLIAHNFVDDPVIIMDQFAQIREIEFG